MAKDKKPADSPLSQRLKSIAERKPLEADAYESVSQSSLRSSRAPTYKPAEIVIGAERLAVVIKNVSSTGAKVEFFQNRDLSGRVRLVEASTGLSEEAEIAWQKGGVIGLKFVKPGKKRGT